MAVRVFYLLALLTLCHAVRTPMGPPRRAFQRTALLERVLISQATWTPGTYYAVGTLVIYNGEEYKVIQAHTAESYWPPNAVASLYTLVGPAPSTPSPSPTPSPTPSPSSSPISPTSSPSSTPSPSPSSAAPDRLVMYWATWDSYPPASVVKTYDAVILFVVAAYNTACSPTFGSYISAAQISYFRTNAPNTKLLFSFGGSGQNSYWQYCSAQPLATALANAVVQNGLDGVDIDYEVAPINTQFLIALTNNLRTALGSSKLITHAPENTQLTTGSDYWNVLVSVKSSISWIGIQYYNDNPGAGNVTATVTHYKNVVTGIFGGDASKVVAGVCITDTSSPNCNSGWDVSGSQAATLTTSLKQAYPSSFGGIFGYQASSDTGAWSAPVITALHA